MSNAAEDCKERLCAQLLKGHGTLMIAPSIQSISVIDIEMICLTLFDRTQFLFEVDIKRGSSHLFLRVFVS